jgi:hypothetical protein
VDGGDLASEYPRGEHERGDNPGLYRQRRSARDEDVPPDQSQRLCKSSDSNGKCVALQREIGQRIARGALRASTLWA